MARNPGIIYETDTGEFALALNRGQHPAFEEVKKVCVHLFVDRLCTVPKVDVTGKPIMVLKAANKLKMIGFSD